MDIKKLNHELGNADLILIDQILKNRFHKEMRILDAGCGEGRNMVFFVRNNYLIFGIDQDPEAVKLARIFCGSLNRDYDVENIQCFPIEDNPFPDGFFDVVICINVLHDARNRLAFLNMFNQLIRLLNSGGFLLLSMESKIGIPERSDMKIYEEEGTKNQIANFYFSEELAREIFSKDLWTKIEPVKTMLFDDTKSFSYLLIKKKV
jgi:SAM-dependent methyltransferase